LPPGRTHKSFEEPGLGNSQLHPKKESFLLQGIQIEDKSFRGLGRQTNTANKSNKNV
jgi:hypothetical protein